MQLQKCDTVMKHGPLFYFWWLVNDFCADVNGHSSYSKQYELPFCIHHNFLDLVCTWSYHNYVTMITQRQYLYAVKSFNHHNTACVTNIFWCYWQCCLLAHELSIHLSILPTLGNHVPTTTNKDRVSEIL